MNFISKIVFKMTMYIDYNNYLYYRSAFTFLPTSTHSVSSFLKRTKLSSLSAPPHHYPLQEIYPVDLSNRKLSRKEKCKGKPVLKDIAKPYLKSSGKSEKSEPDLPESVMKKRRLAANARERQHMDQLNQGFDRLRTVLPGLGPETQLSKTETLQMAQEYINQLSQLLE